MLKSLFQRLKKFFQRLFGGQQTTTRRTVVDVQKAPPPPLNDTDLEFLFTELLEGVHQARGQTWAHKWLSNIEHRVSTARWIEWLRRFGDRLLASSTPNNELAARMVQLGELDVGEVGDVAYSIGMQLLTRNQSEPIWEYDGPDAQTSNFLPENQTNGVSHLTKEHLPESEFISQEEAENLPEGEFQTITIDQLFVLLQQDEQLRQQIAQQLGLNTEDPEEIVQAVINQFQAANQSPTDEAQP